MKDVIMLHLDNKIMLNGQSMKRYTIATFFIGCATVFYRKVVKPAWIELNQQKSEKQPRESRQR